MLTLIVGSTAHWADSARRELSAASGRAAGAKIAAQMDERLRDLVDSAQRRCSTRVALVALGGYGRQELGPYSDVDLLFLTPKEAPSSAASFVDAVLYPLWDMRVDVGHAVRDGHATVDLATQDLTAATALLDARFIAGDSALFQQLLEEARSRLFAPDPNAFIARLQTERSTRAERFGDSVYLLEPDLKSGRGGLRDLCLGLWAAKVRFGITDLEELETVGAATARQTAALCQAREFLWRVRLAAHLWASRRQDHLLFEVQEAIAPMLYPLTPANVSQCVEQLMGDYYLHARAVTRELSGLLDRLHVGPSIQKAPRILDDSLQELDGEIHFQTPDVLRERPDEALRVFSVALERNCAVAHATCDAIAEFLAIAPNALTDNPDAAKRYCENLGDSRDARSPSLLEEMHGAGILASVMPEFAACVARAQHDIYHAYTVDQHSLYAVGALKEIARGAHARDLPLASRLFGEVKHPVSLYLGTLLHDVGKPLGSGHAEKGATLAARIAVRLRLSTEDAWRTEWLVRHHLTLAHLSQRRDLGDRALIERFAETVGNAEQLRQLYLLTVADTTTTAPGNLTTWKLALFDELFLATCDVLEGDPQQTHTPSVDEIAALVPCPPNHTALVAFLKSLPPSYAAKHSASSIARHIRLVERRREKPLQMAVRHHRRKASSEITLVCVDSPGLLARIVGVMLAHRIDIVGAEIHTRGGGEALDIFHVRDRYGQPILEPKRWHAFRNDLEAVLTKKLAVEDLIASSRRTPNLPPRRRPPVATEIRVDNDSSASFTIFDIFTADRLGVLYSITRTLTDLGLDIAFSRVATEADRVADAFYVRDAMDASKISDANRLDAIRRALLQVLQNL